MVEIKNILKKEKFLKLMRQTELVLLLFVLSFALILDLPIVRSGYVVAGVKTKVNLEYGGHSMEFITYKTTLIDAISEQGIKVFDQDEFTPSRETKLNGGELGALVIKSWPVVILDNGQKIDGRATSDDPQKVLEQNKIQVWPEDIVASDLILNPLKVAGAGQLVSIKRAPVYKVSVDRKIKQVRTWDRDVRTIVEKSETKLNPNDIVVPGLRESISNGSTIAITRINYADISKTEAIPYKTIYQGSTSLAFGAIRSIVSGITGAKKNTFRVTYKNGEEISRRLTASTVVRAKRDAKILRGAVTGVCKWGPYYETHYGPYTTAFHYAKREHDPSLIGRYILVTNLANGKSVKVRVVDAGPNDGILDLSTTAMREIGGPNVTFFGHIDNVMVELLD